MELIRGRWFEQYINCKEDKRNYDYIMRGRMHEHHEFARTVIENQSIPDLTPDEKKNIDQYWGQFGIHLTDYSYHRMYYHVTGIRDVRFVPDYIAGHIVYVFYNDHAYEYTWRDKNMLERLLPDVPFPKTLAKCSRNRFVADTEYYLRNEIHELSENIFEQMRSIHSDCIIIKPARRSGFGRGVKKYEVHSISDLFVAVLDWNGESDFIIQEHVKQHPVFEALNPSSTNMLRICSWRHNKTVDILFAATRIGVPGAITDVSFINGLEQVNVMGITPEGCFKGLIRDQNGVLVKSDKALIQPVPAWNEIIDIIKRNHLMMDNFDIVGWDFTVDENEKPVCFEWNVQWPGTVLYQFVNGPLWGEYTDQVLSFLKDERNKQNYIPCYLSR